MVFGMVWYDFLVFSGITFGITKIGLNKPFQKTSDKIYTFQYRLRQAVVTLCDTDKTETLQIPLSAPQKSPVNTGLFNIFENVLVSLWYDFFIFPFRQGNS